MREINRTQYLRGTKAWKARNWFVFGGLAFTVVFGFATVLLFPDQVTKMRQRADEEEKRRQARREKILAIQRHRMEVLEAMQERED